MQTPIICLLLALEYIYTAFACLLGHRANTRWRRPGLEDIVSLSSSSTFRPQSLLLALHILKGTHGE